MNGQRAMQGGAFLVALLGVVLGLSACEQSAGQTSQPTLVPQASLDKAQITRGRAVYEQNCQRCHGPEGKGQPGDWRQRKPDGLFPPPPLDDTAHAWHHPTEILKKSIKQGSPPDVGDMPTWEGKLSETEIDDVIVYVKSLWSPEIYGHWMEVEQSYLAQ